MEFPPPPRDVWARDMGNAEDLPDAAPGFEDWILSYMSETLGHAPQDQAMPPAALGMPSIEFGAAPPPLHMGGGPGHELGQEFVSSTSNSAEHAEQDNGAAAAAAAGGHTAHTGEDKASQRALKVAEKNRRAQKRFREREKLRKATLESQVAELSSRLSALVQEKARLQNRNSILEKVVELKEQHIADLEAKTPKDAAPALNAALCDFYEVVKKDKCAIWRDKGEIPLSVIQAVHKAYIDEMAACLMEGAEDPALPAHARMLELIAAMRTAASRLAVLNDKLFMRVHAEQIPPGANGAGGAPDRAHWRRVLEEVRMTAAQKEAVLGARARLLQHMHAIVEERRSIVAALQGISTATGAADGDPYSKQFGRHTAMEALQKNLREEYRTVLEFDIAFRHTILEPLQQARMQVASYPWSTNHMAICALIAEEVGGASSGADASTGDAPGGQQQGADEAYTALLQGLSEQSPFRAIASPMVV